MTILRVRHLAAAAFFILLVPVSRALAGPPFITDDPDMPDYKHWEIEAFSTYSHTAGIDTLQGPAVELDYGALPDIQVHTILPMTLNREPGDNVQYGYGDTELGIKYRFLHETDTLPEAAIYPLVEVPSGDEGRGLGAGHLQVFSPLWLQKAFGEDKSWWVFGGGGFWYNRGDDSRNFWRYGVGVEHNLSDFLTLGGEVFHETSAMYGESGHTALNFGGSLNFDEYNHLLFSVGRDILGPNRFMCYLGYELTY